jgi:CubicO group peptidase (beta-lactamase class C family)
MFTQPFLSNEEGFKFLFMKKIFLTAIAITAVAFLFAQEQQKEKIGKVKDKVVVFFNAKQADSIYSLAGAAFKKQLNDASFKSVAENQLFPLGKMKSVDFEKFTQGVSKYKVTFDNFTASMYLSLDTAEKLEVFLFQPYKDESVKRTTAVATDNPLSNTLDKFVDTIMKQYFADLNTVGASVSVLQNGKTFFYNYGETKQGNHQLPTVHSIYEIGSISKTFTATLLAFAVNEGKAKLNDPVNKYLPKDIPALEFNGKPITLEGLSNHSSGLPRLPDNLKEVKEDNPYHNYDEQAMMEFLRHVKLTREQGAEYEYSNFAVGLLGVILEKIYKKPYDQLVLEKICTPLQMTETIQYISKKDTALFVSGHNEQGKPVSQWDFKAIAAAGALRTSTTDLIKYANANLFTNITGLNKAIQLTHIKTFSKGINEVGLGWHFIKLNDHMILSHGGGTGGFRTTISFDTEKKIAVVILSNSAIDLQSEGYKILSRLGSTE